MHPNKTQHSDEDISDQGFFMLLFLSEKKSRYVGYIITYDFMPKDAQMGGQIFECQQNPFQTLCLVVALCVRS